jgi:hypothetical protein
MCARGNGVLQLHIPTVSTNAGRRSSLSRLPLCVYGRCGNGISFVFMIFAPVVEWPLYLGEWARSSSATCATTPLSADGRLTRGC